MYNLYHNKSYSAPADGFKGTLHGVDAFGERIFFSHG